MSMQAPHWTEAYLGLPYEKGGMGPDVFNCWSFFRHVQLAEFGRAVPAIEEPDRLMAIARMFRDRRDSLGWVKVADRRSGDAVLMAHANHASHVGIWVADIGRGAVLHSVPGAGSVCHPIGHLEIARWRLTDFYRPAVET